MSNYNALPQQPAQLPVGQQPMQPGVPPVMNPNLGPISEEDIPPDPLEVKIYSHSSLFYWWPVWVVGYVMAFVTYLAGQTHPVGTTNEQIHGDTRLGVIYFLTLFLVILITNVSVRGLASALVVMGIAMMGILLAYLNLWDDVLAWVGGLKIHLNMGAYLVFSTLMFSTWVLSVFVFDRLTFWRIKPGQITHEFVFGAGSKTYDTNGMMLEKHRDDVFRHWLLGLGAGDLHIQTMGATRDRIDIPNVLFVGRKVQAIQRLIAMQPDQFGHATIK